MDNTPSTPGHSDGKKLPTTFGLPKLREQVIDMLEKAFVNNDLDSDDYEKRLVMAHGAQSVEELKIVIHDFPQKHQIFPTSNQQRSPRTSSRSNQLPAPVQGFIQTLESADAFTLIGDCHIAGIEVNKPNVKIVRGIGNSVIDLRDVGHKFGNIRVESYGLIGDIKVLVPANAKVKRKIFLLLGEKTQRIRSRAQSFFDRIFGSNTKTPFNFSNNTSPEINVEISGFNLIGNLVVEYHQDE